MAQPPLRRGFILSQLGAASAGACLQGNSRTAGCLPAPAMHLTPAQTVPCLLPGDWEQLLLSSCSTFRRHRLALRLGGAGPGQCHLFRFLLVEGSLCERYYLLLDFWERHLA
jgi:hypothetical protein